MLCLLQMLLLLLVEAAYHATGFAASSGNIAETANQSGVL